MRRSGRTAAKRPWGAAIAVAGVLLVSACGGSSARTTSSRTDTGSQAVTVTSATVTGSTAPPATQPPGPHHPSHGQPVHPSHPHGKHGPSEPPSLGPELTVAALEQKVNSACAAANAKQAALAQPSDFATNAKAAAAYLNKVVSIKEAEFEALRVNAPRSIRSLYVRFFGDTLHQQLLVVAAANQAQSARRGYASQYQAALAYAGTVLAPLARQLHLSSCAG